MRILRAPVWAPLLVTLALAGCGGSGATPPDPEAPGLRARADDGRVRLSFVPPASGARGWAVQRRTCGRCPWTTVAELGPARTGWVDTDGVPGATLGHRVVATAADGRPRASAPTRTDVGGRAELGFVSSADLVGDGRTDVSTATSWLRRMRTEGRAPVARLNLSADDVAEGSFAAIDRRVEAAARAGADVLGIVQPRYEGDDPWVATDLSEVATNRISRDPGVRAQYARFAADLVARYGVDGTFWAQAQARGVPRRPVTRWQLGNEPWYDGYGVNESGAAAYTDVYVQAARAVRTVDPVHARLLMPTADALLSSRTVLWVRGALSGGRAARLRGLVDAFTAHPYAFPLPATATSPALPPDPARCVERAEDPVAHARSFCRVRTLGAELHAIDPGGLGEVPIWITELGMATCDPRDGAGWNDADRCVSEAQQAAGVTAIYGLLRRWTAERGPGTLRLAGLTWYLDADQAPRDDANPPVRDPVPYYGLFRYADRSPFGGAPKPGWDVWRREAATGIPAGPAR